MSLGLFNYIDWGLLLVLIPLYKLQPLDIRYEFVILTGIGREAINEAAREDEEGLVRLATLATEDQQLVDDFLTYSVSNIIAWHGDKEYIYTDSIRDVLYKRSLRDEVLACYAEIMNSHRYREEHRVQHTVHIATIRFSGVVLGTIQKWGRKKLPRQIVPSRVQQFFVIRSWHAPMNWTSRDCECPLCVDLIKFKQPLASFGPPDYMRSCR